jgi:tetratricopeptide (TPR) repeat protein
MRFLTVFFTFFVTYSLSGQNIGDKSDVEKLLMEADYHYEEKNYVEAFDSYKMLFDQGFVSENMLLKMAYIQEIQKNLPLALFYLNNALEIAPNQKTLTKINTLAQENGIPGYAVSDIDRIHVFYEKFKWILYTVLVGLILFSLFDTWRSLKAKGVSAYLSRPLVPVLVLLIISNISSSEQAVILNQTPILLMDEPGAGADLIDENLKAGQKLDLLEVSPLWSKVRFGEQEGFIRNGQLLFFPPF